MLRGWIYRVSGLVFFVTAAILVIDVLFFSAFIVSIPELIVIIAVAALAIGLAIEWAMASVVRRGERGD